MSKIPFIKFYPSDWAGGCATLEPFEELVYFKVCLHNWNTGEPIPHALLERSMRGHSEGIADALSFLVSIKKIAETDDGFVNSRAVGSYDEAKERVGLAKKAAGKRWKNKKKLNNAPALNPQCEGNANQNQNQNHIQNIDEKFGEFLSAYPSRKPHQNPKKPASDKFAQKVKQGDDPEQIIEAAKTYADTCRQNQTDPKFIAQAVTWLNQERYKDDTPQDDPPTPEEVAAAERARAAE